jgi:carboxymethylenebutenolidase
MCHSDDSRPPLPPVSGGAGDYGDLVLEARDGTKLSAYYAHPDEPTDRAMIVLPDVRGLHSFYKELARRFAEAGMHSVAIDYFGRTAGMGDREEGFEFMPHVQQLQPDTLTQDVAAAAGWLKSDEGGGAKSIFTVGFCMGGAISWNQSAAGLGLAGCVGFYGQPQRVEDRIAEMKAPLLVLVAGNDFTPLEAFEKFDKDLTAGGVPHEMQVYPGAPHSYFDRAFDQYKDECDDSWRRILAFVDTNSTS